MAINYDKTNVVHFRRRNKALTKEIFKCGSEILKVVSQYKYLGIILNEFLNFNNTADMLASAAGRALGSIIGKAKNNKDLGYHAFTTLYNNCVVPVMDYASAVWGRKTYKICDNVQLRACRFHMGISRLAPIPGIVGDMGWRLLYEVEY